MELCEGIAEVIRPRVEAIFSCAWSGVQVDLASYTGLNVPCDPSNFPDAHNEITADHAVHLLSARLADRLQSQLFILPLAADGRQILDHLSAAGWFRPPQPFLTPAKSSVDDQWQLAEMGICFGSMNHTHGLHDTHGAQDNLPRAVLPALAACYVASCPTFL